MRTWLKRSLAALTALAMVFAMCAAFGFEKQAQAASPSVNLSATEIGRSGSVTATVTLGKNPASTSTYNVKLYVGTDETKVLASVNGVATDTTQLTISGSDTNLALGANSISVVVIDAAGAGDDGRAENAASLTIASFKVNDANVELNSYVTPAGVNGNIDWTTVATATSGIIAIDQANQKITGVKAGSALVTCKSTSASGAQDASFTVNVKAVGPSLKVTPDTLSLDKGGAGSVTVTKLGNGVVSIGTLPTGFTCTLDAGYTTSDTTQKYTFKFDGTTATTGNATFTVAASSDGNYSADTTGVNVALRGTLASSITLSPAQTSLSLKTTDSVYILTVTSANAITSASSNNESVAKITPDKSAAGSNDYYIKPQGAGTATITITDGTSFKYVTVTVTDASAVEITPSTVYVDANRGTSYFYVKANSSDVVNVSGYDTRYVSVSAGVYNNTNSYYYGYWIFTVTGLSVGTTNANVYVNNTYKGSVGLVCNNDYGNGSIYVKKALTDTEASQIKYEYGIPLTTAQTSTFYAFNRSGGTVYITPETSTTIADVQPRSGASGSAFTLTVNPSTTKQTAKFRIYSTDTSETAYVYVFVGTAGTPVITLTFSPDINYLNTSTTTTRVKIHVENPINRNVTITRTNSRIQVTNSAGVAYSLPLYLVLDSYDNAYVWVKANASGSVNFCVSANGADTVYRTFNVSGYPTLPQTGPDYTAIYIVSGLCLATLITAVILNVRKKKQEQQW